MLYNIKGDLTKVCYPSIIAHQVNPRVLGPVLAAALAEAFPYCAEDFQDKRDNGTSLKLGEIQLCLVKSHLDLYVAHCCGQLTTIPGMSNTVPTAVNTYLKKLCHLAKGLDLPVLLPQYLGCGQGGGNWAQIKQMIFTQFKGDGVDCYVVEYDETQCPILEGAKPLKL